MMFWSYASAARLTAIGLILGAAGATVSGQTSQLKKLSLLELASIEVTSVSKRPEKLIETPSAIQVITGDEIRRAGATNLADALRLAPNLEVQQINAYAWVVSARGFDALFSNKLLVMIDGRSVYTPLDAGVFWDAQNVLLEDIERIEVVSGPGGTLWGANAVNGVINIITRNATDTQGVYASASVGSSLQGAGAARYGGKLGAHGFFRAYGQRFDRESTVKPDGSDGLNAWNMTHGGFRADFSPSSASALTVQGDVYSGAERNTAAAPGESTLDGQNILARWKRTRSAQSDLTVQMYVDRTFRNDLPSTVTDELYTYDVDVQHRFPVGKRHGVIWGGGYRLMRDDTPTSTIYVGFVPQRRTMQLFSTFAQDEFAWAANRAKLTFGTKLEHTEYSGFEIQPSVRMAWTATPRHTLWGAVSRAVRAPSRIDVDYRIPKAAPYAIAGGPEFDSETVLAYEAGYRVEPVDHVMLSVATFFNDYSKIYSVELANPPAPLPYTIQNGTDGQSYGVEFKGTVQVISRWSLRGGYTYLKKSLWSMPGHNVTAPVLASLGNDPQHQFLVHSLLDLPGHLEFDVVPRYVSALPDPKIPSYFTADVKIAWQMKNLELSVTGRDLLDARHKEYMLTQEVPRSVVAKIDWRY